MEKIEEEETEEEGKGVLDGGRRRDTKGKEDRKMKEKECLNEKNGDEEEGGRKGKVGEKRWRKKEEKRNRLPVYRPSSSSSSSLIHTSGRLHKRILLYCMTK